MQAPVAFTLDDFDIPEDVTVDIYGKEVLVKSNLNLTETISFVGSVASTVIDSETGDYRPELFDFAFGAMLLMYFTNIALPTDSGEQFKLVCHTDLCFEVRKNLDTELLDSLYAAADQKISHLLRCAENTLASKMADLVASFAQLQDMTRDVFSSVGGADLKAMVDNLSGMDGAAMAKAILNFHE
jgi:hypothetical protein